MHVLLPVLFALMVTVAMVLGGFAIWHPAEPLHSELSNTAFLIGVPGVIGLIMSGLIFSDW